MKASATGSSGSPGWTARLYPRRRSTNSTNVVSRDIRFDFGEDEVLFYLDPDSFENAVSVVVYDAPSEKMRLAAG